MAETIKQPDANTARAFGVKGGINVGGGGTARDVGFGGSSRHLVGDPIPDMDANNKAIEGSEEAHAKAQAALANGSSGQEAAPAGDAQAEMAFGRNAQRTATSAAQAAFGPSSGMNVYDAARSIMSARSARAARTGEDVNTHGLYKQLHAMGYKTDGKNVLGNIANGNALSLVHDRLVKQAEAKANRAIRSGMRKASAGPTAQEIADGEIGKAAQAKRNSGIVVSRPPSYARGGASGEGDANWLNVGGYLHQMDGVDVNDPEAVERFRADAQERMDFVNDGGYFYDNNGFA